jgi:uncharacterized cupredoxin-like copper-binding protein
MKRQRKLLIWALPTVVLGALAVAACNKHTTPSPLPVAVTLRSFHITLGQSTVQAGTIIFNVSNRADEDHHEFLVIRTDRAPDALPREPNGSYLEDGPGTQLLDEIDDVAPGETKQLSIDLAKGNYVLICNMVHLEDDGTLEVHYQLGMHEAFRVE